ncbi:MAG: P-loop NTPase fold protein [Imperialibacter sp.]|uniref:P-loop NTPase fold protein n=1 Tax=Imperialibacter sp. TaxID=2038411 RepID=UPI003A85A237
MTKQEIEDVILVSIYLQSHKRRRSIEQILAENDVPHNSQELKEVLEALAKKSLAHITNDPKDGAVYGEITKIGQVRVERELRNNYLLPKLNFEEIRKGLKLENYLPGSYDLVKVDDTEFAVTINQPGFKTPQFKFVKSGLLYFINYSPSGENISNPVNPRGAVSHFYSWLEELKKLPSPEVFQKFKLSIDGHNTSLEDIGFENQGLIGFLLTNKKKFTAPLVEFTSKDVPNRFVYNTSLERESAQKSYDAGRTIGHGYTSPMGEDTIELKRYGLERSTLFVTNPLEDIPFSDETTMFQPPIHLLKKEKEGTVPIYVYSNIPDQKYFEPLATKQNKAKEKETENLNEVVTLQGDGPTKDDKLLRQPFVNAVVAHIKRYWEEAGNYDSYSIHLDGEWGSGKSSILDMLELELKKDSWAVVKYNAWQNQHLENPWWILIYRVYLVLKAESSFLPKVNLWLYNIWWGWMKPNVWSLISFVLLGLTGYLSVKCSLPSLLFPSLSNIKDQTDTTIGILTFSGSAYLLIKSFLGSISPGLSRPEDSFLKNIKDPMNELKNYFAAIIKRSDKHLAVFIDDLDRCNIVATVKLLEGIQTLFKDQKVLYVFSGDGKWITKCFEFHYSEFADFGTQGRGLGDLFLAKAFQMSISVPKMSPQAKSQYLRFLLNITEMPVEDSLTASEAQKIKVASSEQELSNIIETNKSNPNTNHVELRKNVSERLADIDLKSELSHVLLSYESDLDPNPRSIKRFINNYSLTRNALFLEGKTLEDVSQHDLIKWLILCSRWPSFAYGLKNNPEKLDEFKDQNSTFNDYVDGWLKSELVRKLF